MPPNLVLATINARYIHTAFGLRSLLANMGSLREQSQLLEFTANIRPVDIVEAILVHQPAVVGLSVAIWNVEPLFEVASLMKAVEPGVKLVLGGPEVGRGASRHAIEALADVVVAGEGEVVFPEVCRALLAGDTVAPQRVAAPPDLAQLELPYDLYTHEDLAHRVLYVETSRGCPYGCEFCLSALDRSVRRFPLDRVLVALELLWQRGARRFKFMDRALHLTDSERLLQFFLQRDLTEAFLHFEVVPDRISASVRTLLEQFPPGAVQLEAGVQTFTPEVARRIGRRQDADKVVANLRHLAKQTGCHVHADLVAGLPGETVNSLAQSFDQLMASGVQEIQFGILKRLRGAPIARHDVEWGMVYAHRSPYEVLMTATISFQEMQGLKRFARYLDLVVNSGNFKTTLALLGQPLNYACLQSLFDGLWQQLAQTAHIELDRLATALFDTLVTARGLAPESVARAIQEDWRRANRRRLPRAVVPFAPRDTGAMTPPHAPTAHPKRQRRHHPD